MISWIQKYFQRHFRLIFAVMLVAMVVPLIWIFNASSGIGRTERHVVERRVFGYNLGSQEDQSRLFGDASLSAQLQLGYSGQGPELENYAFHRAALLELANRLHIPPASKQELADYIKGLRIFAGPDGQFDASRYAMFRDSLKSNPRMNEGTVIRVLGDEVRTSKVENLLTGPGFVLPAEVRGHLEQSDTTWSLDLATVDYASFDPSIPVNDVILTRFFDENIFRYEIPPRIDVSYANFPASRYLSSIAVTEPEVHAYYDANPARFPKPATEAKSPKRDAAADYAAVRPQVEAVLKLERARNQALKAASDFSLALYDRQLTPGTPAFDAFLAGQKLTLNRLAPFTHESGPAEFPGDSTLTDEAFKLGPDRLYSDAVGTPTGAVVLFWKDLQPARKPALAEVRAKVTADYVDGEKRKRFVELGRTLRAELEAGLKQGESFDKAVATAAAANRVRITAKTVPPFTRRQPPQDVDYSVFGTLDRLNQGQVSDMVIAKDHGLLVYAAGKKLPDLSPANPQFAAARAQLAFGTGRVAAASYLEDRIRKELKSSEVVEQ